MEQFNQLVKADQKNSDSGKAQRKPSRLRNFVKNFVLWMAGTAIGVVPIYLKQVQIAAVTNFPEESNLLNMILSDFDFSFTSVNALFVLFLEGCLLSGDFPLWKSFLRFNVFLCLFALTIVYVSTFTYQNHFTWFWKVTQHDYNLMTLVLAILLGFVCHVAMALRKEETS